jgi:serine/threonine-protein kinase
MLGTLPNQQTDIYALGAILYELLNGSRPHAHLSGLALAAAHMQASSDSWSYASNLPPSLIELIRDMTASKPEYRLASMQAVAGRIAVLDGTTRPANPPVLTQSDTKTSRSSRWAIAGLVTAVILVVAGWQLAPYTSAWRSTISSSLTPYSEALELQQGLAALKLFDRPGSLEAADKNFNTVLSHNPNNAAAVAGLSLVYSFRYMSDEQDEIWLQKADAGAQQALKINDQLALSHVAKGKVLNLQGKAELGLAEQDRALSLDPKNFFAWDEKINALRSLRRYTDASENAELGLQHFPQERIFADQQGAIYFALYDYKAAEQAFKLSIHMQPDAVFSYANLSAALIHQNRNDEALEVLQQGLQIRPSSWLYSNLGNAQFLRGDYIAAAAAFELAVSPDKGNPRYYLDWANLADTLLWIPGRKDEARQAYDKARLLLAPRLARNPNEITLVSRMGLYAARSGNKASAEELIQKSMALAPRDPSVHFRAGLGYELLGDRTEALKAIGKAKKFGYPTNLIESEPDLLTLRRDARYAKK